MTLDVMPFRFTHKGDVPGGHRIIVNPDKETHVPTMRECNSIALRHSDVVVDIGAYCGTYAIRCARHPVKRVVAYEPTPASFDVLSLTSLPNLETVQAAVVGDPEQKVVDLHISAGIGVTNSIVMSNRKVKAITVPAVDYAEAVREATIVKIDVEGAEYGFPIVQPSLRAVIVDFHPIAGRDWLREAERIVGEIEGAGFRPVIAPKWGNGWSRAGSWIRDRPDDGSGFRPMLDGKLCCCCGREISARSKAICVDCAPRIKPKYRRYYLPAR